MPDGATKGSNASKRRSGRPLSFLSATLCSPPIAQIRHSCRLGGHPLHDRSHANDLWIAASAIQIDAALLTADAIFDNTPGLTLHR